MKAPPVQHRDTPPVTLEEWVGRYARACADRERMTEELGSAKESARRIKSMLVCIGGPLNDNVDGYTPKQKATMQRILERAEEIIGETA